MRGTQDRWVRYEVDWTAERIRWLVDGAEVRSLAAADAAAGQYPQTPMRLLLGAWAGGDPARNQQGTVAWARGLTDFSRGPFVMRVRSLAVRDYSTGRQYRYADQSGSWQSIEAVGGAVAPAGSGSGSGPAAPSSSQSPPPRGALPSGWRMTPEGKVVPVASAPARGPPPLLPAAAAVVVASVPGAFR